MRCVARHGGASQREAGLTLVELMVALALGLLVAGAAIAALLVARRGFNNVDSGAQLRENVRFAASVMERIIVQSGYYDVGDGQFPQSGDLPPLRGIEDSSIGVGAGWTPIAGGVNGSDALSVSYFGSSRVAGDPADGSMINCAGIAVPRTATRAVSVFSIQTSSSGEPTLACTYNDPATATWATLPLVSGVESMQILYGVDNVTPNTAPPMWSSTEDSVADRYLRAAQIIVPSNQDATYDNWRRVRTVRIGLVLRGPPGSALTTDGRSRQINVLGGGFSSADDTGSSLTVRDDGRLRQQLVFTVHLRNPQNPGVPPAAAGRAVAMMSRREKARPAPRRMSRPARRSQRGVTLIIVLLILVVVTVVGLGAAQIALLGERSTRYDRDYLIASQAAESALMDAEFDIRGPNSNGNRRVDGFSPDNTAIFLPGCGNTDPTRGLCVPAAAGASPVWDTVDFMATDANARTVPFGYFTGRSFDSGSGVKPDRSPRYIVEQVFDAEVGNNAAYSPTTPPPKLYRITALGFGPRPDIQVGMQVVFRKEQ